MNGNLTTSGRERISFLRFLARTKVRRGAYASIEAILDELRGKASLYRKLGAVTTPQPLRLSTATIQAWETDAKNFAKFAVEHFRESNHG